MQRVLIIGLVAGCSSPNGVGGALGEPCDMTTKKCGDGVVCDYSAEVPTCIDANADPDGDGIPNSLDHCPNVKGGLFDEDGDGIGDECDRCPIAKPPAVPDPDGDDVDSPCDPDPQTPGDKILLFDGFSAGTLDTTVWSPNIPGAWTVEGGELVVRLPTQADQSFVTAIVVAEPNIAVQTSYRVDNLETASPTHHVGAMALDQRPAGVATFECGVTKSDLGGSRELVVLETDQSAVSQPAMVPAFDSASLYRSASYATGQDIGCVIIGDNMPLATIQTTTTPASLGTVRVTASAVTARFQWVLVVGRSNAASGRAN